MNTIRPREGRTEYLTAADVAEWLGVSEKWVYRKSRDGTIPVKKMGRYIRFIPAAIEEWMNESDDA